MKRKIFSVLFIIYFILIIAFLSCTNKGTTPPSADSGADFFYTFEDSLGQCITLKKRPQRVAILFSSLVEIWTLSGGNVDITVGESVERGFVQDSVTLVDEGAGHTSINTEILISEMPDLVICTSDYPIQKDTATHLSSLGIAAAAFKLESFDDYLNVLKIFTDINGTPDVYQEYGSLLKEKIDRLLTQIDTQANHNDQKSILFIRAGSSPKSTKAKNSSDNFACKMLLDLKTYNIADDAQMLLDGLSLEVIIEKDPEYIFITSMGNENASREYINTLFKEAGWNSLSAVKNAKVIFLSKEYFHYKPNQRWYDSYKFLANTLYPDLTIN